MAGLLAGCGGDGGGGDGGSGSGLPSGELTYIVPYGPGGGTDTYARQFQGPISNITGNNVTIENIPGAATFNAVGQMIQSPPDGSTMAAINLPATAASALVQEPDIPVKDITPIAGYAVNPLIYVASPDEGLEYDPETMIERYNDGTYSSVGVVRQGTPDFHIRATQSQFDLNIDTIAGYDGSTPSIQAAASGEVDVAIPSTGAAISAIADGTVEPIMLSVSYQSSIFPETPTFEDVWGDSIDFTSQVTRGWYGPPGMSEDIRARWADICEQTLNSDPVQSWSEETGSPVTFSSGEELGNIYNSMFEKLPEFVDLSKFE